MGKIISNDDYNNILSLKPEGRVNSNDVIDGILVAFFYKCQLRDGWIDCITLSDAQKEIKELIIKCGGDLSKINCNIITPLPPPPHPDIVERNAF